MTICGYVPSPKNPRPTDLEIELWLVSPLEEIYGILILRLR